MTEDYGPKALFKRIQHGSTWQIRLNTLVDEVRSGFKSVQFFIQHHPTSNKFSHAIRKNVGWAQTELKKWLCICVLYYGQNLVPEFDSTKNPISFEIYVAPLHLTFIDVGNDFSKIYTLFLRNVIGDSHDTW